MTKTKQTQIDELNLKVKELELKLAAEEYAHKATKADRNAYKDKAYNLEGELLEKRKNDTEFILSQISKQ